MHGVLAELRYWLLRYRRTWRDIRCTLEAPAEWRPGVDEVVTVRCGDGPEAFTRPARIVEIDGTAITAVELPG